MLRSLFFAERFWPLAGSAMAQARRIPVRWRRKLSLYRTAADWAMVIEVFGFSHRSGLPDTHIHTFSSSLYNRDAPEKYVNGEAYHRYLANNPHNDSRFVYPIDGGGWQDDQNDEIVAEDAREVVLRGQRQPIPSLDEYGRHG